jgi:hypothetical protein
MYSYTNSFNKTYYLHAKDVVLKSSNYSNTVYYFASNPKEGVLDAVPDGWEVVEISLNKLPVLKRKK